MIGIAFLVLAVVGVSLYLRAVDARDERRRAERLAQWHKENERETP